MASRGNGFNNRGRGRGRGRGASPFRGRPGRGQPYRGRGNGRPTYGNLDIIDVDVQQYADDVPTSGNTYLAPQAWGRGAGRGRGRRQGSSTPLNLQVFDNGNRTPPPPRREDGSGTGTPAGRGAGRGPSRGLGARYNPNMSLSKLLALDRPYLRPINFVPAQLTPVLFQREEELIEVHEIQEPEDHVPTAEQVSRVFSHQESEPLQESFFQNEGIDLFADADSEPIVTVDFGSLGTLLDGTSNSQPEPEHETKPSEPVVPNPGQAMNVFDTIMQALTITNTETTTATSPDRHREPELHLGEEINSEAQEPTLDIQKENREDEKEDEQPLFVIDAVPARHLEQQEKIVYAHTVDVSQPLGSVLPDDDEVIVYDAPHPRSRRATPRIPDLTDTPTVNPVPCTVHIENAPLDSEVLGSPSTSRTSIPQPSLSIGPTSVTTTPIKPFDGMSFSFDAISRAADLNRQQTASPRARRLTKWDRKSRASKWKGKKRGSFGIFGAMLEERHLHDDELRLNERRGKREGSDIDWGDENSDSDLPRRSVADDPEIERVSSGVDGMSIDGEIDIQAMQNFVKSMSNKGMEYTRIDDIEDAEKLRREDEEGSESSSVNEDVDSEVDAVVEAEEERLIGEVVDVDSSSEEDDEDDDDDLSSDEDETVMQAFQTRLDRARQSAKAQGKMKESAFSAAQASNGSIFGARMSKLRGQGQQQEDESDDDDDSDDIDGSLTWADQDEEYLADLQDLLDEEDDILLSDRKQRKALFKSVINGDFSVAPAKKRRDYGKDLPPELRAQWEEDRAQKAENKRKRAAARLEVAADTFAVHKGGKKGQKAMLRAALLAEEEREKALRNSAPDMSTLVQQIRAFIGNLDQAGPMSLPPMDKGSRSKVHEVAAAFGLKSQSKGKGATRYTTLIKTSRTSIRIDERKIQRILRSGGDWGFSRPGNPGGGRGKANGAPKHKEGDEVGKAAPKIGEANVGFRMLANMGWAEGEKIGTSGGLEAPLMAIIKHSKLGLGATRVM